MGNKERKKLQKEIQYIMGNVSRLSEMESMLSVAQSNEPAKAGKEYEEVPSFGGNKEIPKEAEGDEQNALADVIG